MEAQISRRQSVPEFPEFCVPQFPEPADYLITKKNLKAWWEEKLEKWNESRVKRRFRKLPEKHQEWLMQTFEQFGNSTFYMRDAAMDEEFFKELQEWNYVKLVTQIMIFPSDGLKYRLTDPGIKQIERFRGRIGSQAAA